MKTAINAYRGIESDLVRNTIHGRNLDMTAERGHDECDYTSTDLDGNDPS
jgi:hypothetical protein